jgi:hypothetical protein
MLMGRFGIPAMLVLAGWSIRRMISHLKHMAVTAANEQQTS